MKKFFAVILTIALVLALFGCSKKPEEEETTSAPETTLTTTQAESTTAFEFPTYNPLTGEDNYNPDAVGKRPVAIVVENLSPARPQWAIGSSDFIVEGEVEGGISRMLWFYADYTKVPDKVGPIRSARPSFVQFSEYFDSIFIHWGGSHNNGDYIGGYGMIKNEGVAHIDGMDGGYLFGRDNTRSVSVEHRGIVHGDKIPQAVEDLGRRTTIKPKYFSFWKFNNEIKDAGKEAAQVVNCKFSSRTDTRAFTYDSKDGLYHTNDWKTDVAFENVIILMADTTYITVPYKGSTTTYVNYDFTKGKGYYASNGKQRPITWKLKGYKLYLKDENDSKVISINKGKSYIGLASANNGGSVTF